MLRAGVVWSLVIAAACGSPSGAARPGGGDAGGGGDPGDGGDPGGDGPGSGSDGGGPACATVCWAPSPEPVTADPWTPPPVVDLTETRCNLFGPTPGSCPAGFACTGTDVTPLAEGHTQRRAVCEPLQHPPAPLVIDLAPPVAVHLRLTLGGGAWPTGGNPGDAGEILFVPRHRGTWTSRITPTDSAELDVELAPDVYDVTVLSFNLNPGRYPSGPVHGVLTVTAAGSFQIDIPGQPVAFVVRVDGAALPALDSGVFWSLTFAGHHGYGVTVTRAGAGDGAGTAVLEPDRYRVTLALGTTGFPGGTVVVADSLEVTGAMSTTFDVATVPISGAVRVDGADASPTDVFIDFGGNEFVVRGPPSRYEGRLLAGASYDVVLSSDALATVPSAATRITPNFVAGPATLDIAVTSTTFSGVFTLNGAPLPAAEDRATLVLIVPGKGLETTLHLTTSGDTRWSERVYTGTYDVEVQHGTPRVIELPPYRLPLESGLAITAPVSRSYNLDTAAVDVALRVDGAQPPDATTERGVLSFQRVGGRDDQGINRLVSRTGPMAVSVVLEPGTWAVELEGMRGYAGIPDGRVQLGNLTVVRGASPFTFDIPTVLVTGEVRLGGAALPPAAAGGSRGTVTLFGDTVELPATGPATFSLRGFLGPYDAALTNTRLTGDPTGASVIALFGGIDYHGP